MLTLRPYQEAAIGGLFDWWQRETGNGLLVLPTGTGKSIVIARLCQLCHEWDPTVRILMLTHVQELVAQNFQELIGLWPEAPVGINSAGLGRREVRQMTFASIQSVWRKSTRFGKIDIVLVDEAHLIPRKDSTMYQKLLGDLRIMNPDIRIVGLTATPYRLDSGRLDEGKDALFAGVAYDYSIRDAIDEGYLVPPVTRATTAVLDTDGVGRRGGEFIPGQLAAAVDISELNEAIVKEVVAKGVDRRSWLFFCSGVEHAQHIAEIVERHGISCSVIHAGTEKDERRGIIAAFKRGEIRALASMNVLTTGFNAPAVDLIAMLRPTESLGLYIQMVGRGTRLAPGKADCLVLDFAKNIERHGPIDVAEARKKFTADAPGEAPVKLCPACHTYVYAATSVCECGYEWPKPELKIVQRHSTAAILSTQAPSSAGQWVPVDAWGLRRHEKLGGIDSLKVTYEAGLTTFNEWICIEHEGFAGDKARAWWTKRGGNAPSPKTIEEALDRAAELVRPDEIFVRPDGKYQKIAAARNLSGVQSRREALGPPHVSRDWRDEVPF